MESTASWIAFNGFSGHIAVLCAVTLGLLCVSALVSGAETSFFSLSHKDIRRLQTRTTASAEAVLHLLTNVDVLLATILVVNNLVNICIVILVSGIIDSVFTFLRFEFLFKTVLVTFLLLLFGEILPKVLAQTMPVRFAQFAARPLRVLRWIFYPLSYILVRTSSRISEKAAHKSEISLDELADAVDMTQSSSPEEHVMLSGIVNFVNTEVQEIMKPRVDITALSVTDDYETVKQTIIRSGFSRIPVYEEDIDNIRGTLYVKDLLPYINHGNEFGWQQLVRKPYFVPEHKKINDLLGDFQSNKVHMAIVVDEYGSTLGLVSLEDIIEEIVGEIEDEFDPDNKYLTRLSRREWLVDGRFSCDDAIELGWPLEESDDYETIAGWILELCDSVPDIGEVFEVAGYKFKVQSMRGQRISLIRVIAPAETDKKDSESSAEKPAASGAGSVDPHDGDE